MRPPSFSAPLSAFHPKKVLKYATDRETALNDVK